MHVVKLWTKHRHRAILNPREPQSWAPTSTTGKSHANTYQLRLGRVVWTIRTTRARKVLIGGLQGVRELCTYRLPWALKALRNRVLAGRVAARERYPRVPDRIQLRGIVVVTLVVHPTGTARLLLNVFPVLVAVAIASVYPVLLVPVNSDHTAPLGIANVLHIAPVLGEAALLNVIDRALQRHGPFPAMRLSTALAARDKNRPSITNPSRDSINQGGGPCASLALVSIYVMAIFSLQFVRVVVKSLMGISKGDVDKPCQFCGPTSWPAPYFQAVQAA